MRLFQISQQIEQILAAAVDQETGEIGEAAIAALDELELARDKRCLEIAAYLKGEEAEGEAVKAQAKALLARAKRHESRAERLRDYIEQHMTPGERLRDDRSELSWRKSQAVQIVDEKAIQAEYLSTVVEVDKAGLKGALKAGAEVPGAELVNRMNLQVK